MKLIELHILQSYPVSCLNRDDLGSPKSAVFGGVKRARISSQCLKRAQREQFQQLAPEYAQGARTKLVAGAIAARMAQEADLPHDADKLAEKLASGVWGKLDTKHKDAAGLQKSMTLAYLAPSEIDTIVTTALNTLRENPACKDAELIKAVCKALKKVTRKDAADIALFGRMVADDPSLNIEGAALFSHAISCHKAEPEIDFFTAVDDLQPEEESGAGMAGILEFNSACYYRYIGINVDLLEQNLPGVSKQEIQAILRAFIQSALTSVPTARKNSMNAATLPTCVLGLRRDNGHPLQLVNAFESPIRAKGSGFAEEAIKALLAERQRMETFWGIKFDATALIHPHGEQSHTLPEFIDTLTQIPE